MQTTRIIGDLHANVAKFPNRPIEQHCADRNYFKIIADTEYSICVGDIGWKENLEEISIADHNRHKTLLGNHSDHNNPPKNYLGRFGNTKLGELNFFFIDGAFSIDHQYREKSGPNQTWWKNEELSYEEMSDCVELYEQVKPEIIISHDCPHFLIGPMLKSSFKGISPSRTARFLEIMWSIRKPSFWYFGHHHQNKIFDFGGTKFVCISELCYVDIDHSGNIINGPI